MGSWELRGVSRITDSYICTILSQFSAEFLFGVGSEICYGWSFMHSDIHFYVGILLNLVDVTMV